MGTSSIRAGVRVAISGTEYKFLRKVDDRLWQLEAARTLRIHEYQTTALLDLYRSGQLIFLGTVHNIVTNGEGRKITQISKKQWKVAKIRRSYVVAVLHLPSTAKRIAPAIAEIWQRLGKPKRCPSPRSVQRWKERYLDSGKDLASLIDQTHRKGNRTPRYPEEIYELVRDVVEEIYLTQERKTKQDVLDSSKTRVKAENELRPKQLSLPFPSPRLIKTVIAETPAFDRIAARYGRDVAMRRFRAVLGREIADYPLERAEIDHTRLDMIVIDEDTFLPLGRPWLTVCLDVRTRCVLGIYLGFEPPSFLTVAKCLKDAFLPKTNLQEEYPSIKNPWRPHGVMHELVVDNGMEFHSKGLENGCLCCGIEMIYSARKRPWHKGKVERFQKTLNDGVAHGTPGTTFSNIFEKDEYDPSKHAVVRLSKIQEIVRKWVSDFYHQKPHRSLGVAPERDWVHSISEEDILLPDDPTIFDALLGRPETRKLTHKGIELDCLFYNSPELTDLRKRYGEKLTVELRIDDADIGLIIVICPKTGDLYKVPAIDSEYASGLSRWQHRVCRKFAADQLDKDDPEAWLEAKEEIAQMVKEEFKIKRRGTRQRAARYKYSPGSTERVEQPVDAQDHLNDTIVDEPAIPADPITSEDVEAQMEIEYRRLVPVRRKRVPSESLLEEV